MDEFQKQEFLQMIRDEATRIAEQKIKDAQEQAAYGVSLIPYHTHDGINSPRLAANQNSIQPAGSNGDIQFNNNGTLAGNNALRLDTSSDTKLILGFGGIDTFSIETAGDVTMSTENGGELVVTTGPVGVGKPISIFPGTSIGVGATPGSLTLDGGEGSASATGSNNGGDVNISGGEAGAVSASGSSGGNVNIRGGTGHGSGNGGAITVTAGTATAGSGGNLAMFAGLGVGSGNAGGAAAILGGAASSNAAGGSAGLSGGAAAGAFQGGNVALFPGNGSPNGVVYAGSGNLATNATGGFFAISTCAGAPTGVPAGLSSGYLALTYDSTNNKLYLYNGAWKSVTLT